MMRTRIALREGWQFIKADASPAEVPDGESGLFLRRIAGAAAPAFFYIRRRSAKAAVCELRVICDIATHAANLPCVPDLFQIFFASDKRESAELLMWRVRRPKKKEREA